MLIKTKIKNEQKYVKISEPSLGEFLNSAFLKFSIAPVSEGVRVFDETGTEIDADVFEEVAQQPNAGVFAISFDSDFQGTTPSDCSRGCATSAVALLDSVANSQLDLSACSADDTIILEVAACSSDDTIILDEDLSPARKWQRAEDQAKIVVEPTLNSKPAEDRNVK
ncbi:uncharacterized protein LOC117818406 [Xyrichtys novacula]|uniref:Uncharacterized protein LOC117818406 n=1 Tax=Xyrichtys novacula TaxID=13765 RepID=A0AAV1FYP2_XYRNO|nr:uncharacterized protein LOC117818406 [Xyrichtys novacula]